MRLRLARASAPVVAVLLAVACSGGGSSAHPTVPSTPPPTEVTTAPTSSTTLVTVPGNPRVPTTLPADLSPGDAHLSGTVVAPEGPVPDAVVHVERFVGDRVAAVNVASVGGQWHLDGIRGGRYRVRAWHAPDLAQLQPEVFFLGAAESRTLTLPMARFGDTSILGSMSPAPPVVGQAAVLTIQIASGGVDAGGIVRTSPRPGITVQLVAQGLAVDTVGAQITDGAGNTAWPVHCVQEGPYTAGVSIGGALYPLGALPACVPGG